jgi:hypothetical protein
VFNDIDRNNPEFEVASQIHPEGNPIYKLHADRIIGSPGRSPATEA